MNPSDESVTITFRIPGRWAHPRELVARLPADFRLTPEALHLPDGTRVEFGAVAADDQFANIFRSSCRRPATADELAAVDQYTVNVLLSGPGGSLTAALAMMRAAAAVVRAGGAGVFIDNSTLAHGGQEWLALTDDGGPDAVSFAFVAIVAGKTDVWTMGMHALGLRDVVMRRADLETEGVDIIDVIRYLARGDKPVGDGHVIANLSGMRFRTSAEAGKEELAGTPMHNPFGRLRLVSLKDIAGAN